VSAEHTGIKTNEDRDSNADDNKDLSSGKHKVNVIDTNLPRSVGRQK